MRAKPAYQNASGWVTQAPTFIAEGFEWTSFGFTNGGAYMDRNTTFELDSEL